MLNWTARVAKSGRRTRKHRGETNWFAKQNSRLERPQTKKFYLSISEILFVRCKVDFDIIIIISNDKARFYCQLLPLISRILELLMRPYSEAKTVGRSHFTRTALASSSSGRSFSVLSLDWLFWMNSKLLTENWKLILDLQTGQFLVLSEAFCAGKIYDDSR